MDVIFKISPMVNVDYSFIRVPEFKVCSHETTVENGRFEASIPRRYGYAFKEGLARIDIKKPKLSVLTINIRIIHVNSTAFCTSSYTHRFFNDRWYSESETIGQSVCCKQYGCVGINGFYQFLWCSAFYGETLSSGIKPIIGADIHVKSELCGEELFTLTLLAKNNEGYKNITLLLSKSLSAAMWIFLILTKRVD